MRKKLFAFTISFTMLLSILATSFACATVSVKASMSGGGTYEKGSNITVKLTYTGATFGSATAYFEYDSSVLQLVSTSDGPQSASGSFYQNIDNEYGANSLTATATFKAIGTGKTTVRAEFLDGSTLDFETISANDAYVTITVKDSSSAVSSNANLSSMSVSAGSLSPSFSPSVTSYTVNVGSDVSVCTISAKAQDSKATISVSGSKNLKAGKNVRSVTVTAENGSTKTYTITIYKAEGTTGGNDKEDPDLPDEQPETPEEIKITLGGKEYVLDENISENNIPEGFTITSAMYGQQEIPVIKDSQLKYTFALLKDGETGDSRWFFFNEENDTFSSSVEISSEDAMKYAQLVAAEDTNGSEPSGIGMTEKILYIALGVTVAALILTVAVMKIKRKKREKRETPSID